MHTEGDGDAVCSGVGEAVSVGEGDSCANNPAVAPRAITKMSFTVFVMSSGNVTLHPFYSGAAAMVRACPERAE